jgi:hypothetical protein
VWYTDVLLTPNHHGVTDGTRTRVFQDHNLALYPLSHCHHAVRPGPLAFFHHVTRHRCLMSPVVVGGLLRVVPGSLAYDPCAPGGTRTPDPFFVREVLCR